MTRDATTAFRLAGATTHVGSWHAVMLQTALQSGTPAVLVWPDWIFCQTHGTARNALALQRRENVKKKLDVSHNSLI
jgi:hypothetical protein